MSEVLQSDQQVHRPVEDSEVGYYNFKELLAHGFVRSRSDLRLKIVKYGFPKPVKNSAAMQSKNDYPKDEVHEWDRRRRAARSAVESA